MLSDIVSTFLSILQTISSYVGYGTLAIITWWLLHPDSFDRVLLCAQRVLASISRAQHKKYISKFIEFTIAKELRRLERYFRINLRRVRIEWTDIDDVDAILEREHIIIRFRHHRNMKKNMAIAITTYVLHAFPPTMRVVITDNVLLDAIGYLITRDIVKDDPYLVHEVKSIIDSHYEKLELQRLYEIIDKLDEIYAQNLVIKLLMPELIEVTSSLYPKSPPDLIDEIVKFIDFLYMLSIGKLEEPIFRGKYFRVAIVRVALPEKILFKQLKPHLDFIEYAVNKHLVNTVCILAAGLYKPYWAKKLALEASRKCNLEVRVDETYEAKYRGGTTYVYCAILKRRK